MLAWWILIPLLLFFDPDLPRRIGTGDPGRGIYTVWYNIVRPIAVGTMLVGAANTMWSMRQSLIDSVRGVFVTSARAAHREETRRSARARYAVDAGVVLGILALLVPIASIYYGFTHGMVAAMVSALVMTRQRISSLGRWAATSSVWWALPTSRCRD